MVRVAIQGDIGQQVYHVGDEAMVHAAVEQLKRRGICSVVLLTRDPAQTRVHFGAELDAAPTLVFPWPPVDRERYLGEIKAVLAGDTGVLPPHDQVFGVIETLRQVDALFIAGGGNMNSRYGWLLYERAAMAHIAARLAAEGSDSVLGVDLNHPGLANGLFAEVLARLPASVHLLHGGIDHIHDQPVARFFLAVPNEPPALAGDVAAYLKSIHARVEVLGHVTRAV